jgi:hypothetical protein
MSVDCDAKLGAGAVSAERRLRSQWIDWLSEFASDTNAEAQLIDDRHSVPF